MLARLIAHLSVNGAVKSLPLCVTWRNSRHVPVAGSSTPSSSCPGFVLWPVVAGVPKPALQAGSLPQMCEWK